MGRSRYCAAHDTPYTLAPIFIYFALRFWNFGSIAHEMVTRLSLILASVATAGLIVLSVTSVDAVVQRVFTMLLEAVWLWAYQGYRPQETLANNFIWVEDLSPAGRSRYSDLRSPLWVRHDVRRQHWRTWRRSLLLGRTRARKLAGSSGSRRS